MRNRKQMSNENITDEQSERARRKAKTANKENKTQESTNILICQKSNLKLFQNSNSENEHAENEHGYVEKNNIMLRENEKKERGRHPSKVT